MIRKLMVALIITTLPLYATAYDTGIELLRACSSDTDKSMKEVMEKVHCIGVRLF